MNKISRRDALKSVLVLAAAGVLPSELTTLAQSTRKHIYIALDDHTDYMWTADEATYQNAFVEMIDYYLNLADSTSGNVSEHQSRFNCDGSFWLWTYERKKSASAFNRLINRVKSGHITFPLNALVVCLGGAPAEGVLRGLYYSGHIERRHNIRFKMAVCMENQTLPYGLVSLFAGAGAEFSWKGICGCASKVPNAGERDNEIYWWTGPDGSRMLMKWNSLLSGSNEEIGGYAEARNPSAIVDYVTSNATFLSAYPYSVIGAFGKGWDDLITKTDEFVNVAKSKTNANRLVVVSNQVDFFEDFDEQYGDQIPSESVTYGNEWDAYCASLAEVSASVKRSTEKLRGAEALASLVCLQSPTFMDNRNDARDQAWMNLGLYWEHNWTADGSTISNSARANWQRQLATGIKQYVDTLQTDAVSALGGLISKSGTNTRFFVFNPLSWTRTSYADFAYNGTAAVHVVDVDTEEEVPSQIVQVNGQSFLRILATDVPSIGYKVFEIQAGAGTNFGNAATVANGVIESSKLKVTVAPRGAITSLIDKTRSNREFAATTNNIAMNDLGAGSGTLQVENSGPVSVTLRATRSSAPTAISRITLVRDADNVLIHNTITQNFDSIRTWGFNFNLPTSPDVWHEEVGAIIRAKLASQGGHYANRAARYDWLTLNHFADITGSNNFGVTLSNADCYFMQLGNSTATNLDTQTPRISVLAGGQVDGPGLGIRAQGGDTTFVQQFGLRPHDAYNQVTAMRFALEHQNPFITGAVSGGSAYPADNYSMLSLSSDQVLLWALKPAEDGFSSAGLAARVWNLADQSADTVLAPVVNQLTSAQQATHIETPLQSVPLNGNSINISLAKQQIKTFMLKLDSDAVIPLVPPTMLAPANAAIVEDIKVELTWAAVNQATGYDVLIGTTNPPTGEPIHVTTAKYKPSPVLLTGEYFWQVRSVRGSEVTDWTAPRSLTVIDNSAAAPRLNLATGAPILSWQVLTWADGYGVEIATNTNFTPLVYSNDNISGLETTFTPPTLEPGMYFWRVRARDYLGNWGKWSVATSLVIPHT